MVTWLRAFRFPFHSVGILPLWLGMVLAFRETGQLQWLVGGLATFGLMGIMAATYLFGEVADVEGDRHNRTYNRFSGGSRVLADELLSQSSLIGAGVAAAFVALGVGLLLQLKVGTGTWTIPMGLGGLATGLLYSCPPIRWSHRGMGELWIAFCYGWLTVNAGYYLQTGSFRLHVGLFSIPIAFSIFNVILINEIPDYDADRMVGKRNLVVRLGHDRAIWLYRMVAVAVVASFVAVTLEYFSTAILLFSVLLSALAAWSLLGTKGNYTRYPARLEATCARTLVLNLTVVTFLSLAR
jgi:1,4-dihydroxy-2-naphthoate octaprenyltransferase